MSWLQLTKYDNRVLLVGCTACWHPKHEGKHQCSQSHQTKPMAEPNIKQYSTNQHLNQMFRNLIVGDTCCSKLHALTRPNFANGLSLSYCPACHESDLIHFMAPFLHHCVAPCAVPRIALCCVPTRSPNMSKGPLIRTRGPEGPTSMHCLANKCIYEHTYYKLVE